MLRMTFQATMVGLALFLLAPWPGQADEVRLNSIGVRGGPTGGSPIGDLETQYFKEYDLMANWSLPWGWYSESGGSRHQADGICRRHDCIWRYSIYQHGVARNCPWKEGRLAFARIRSRRCGSEPATLRAPERGRPVPIGCRYGDQGEGLWRTWRGLLVPSHVRCRYLWRGCPWNGFSYDRGQLSILTVPLQNASSRPSVVPTGFSSRAWRICTTALMAPGGIIQRGDRPDHLFCAKTIDMNDEFGSQ